MQEYKVTVYYDGTVWRDLKTLKRHRLDGPACEFANGSKHWYVEGQLHRLDGPAREYADGFKEWYAEGKRHRLDGPACEYANGFKEWYVEGKYMTEEEFNEYVEKLNKSIDLCSDKVVEIEGRKYRLTALD